MSFMLQVTKLVIDISAVTFIDPSSAKTVLNIDSDLDSQQITLCLCKCSGEKNIVM